jgi:hypothetical protein
MLLCVRYVTVARDTHLLALRLEDFRCSRKETPGRVQLSPPVFNISRLHGGVWTTKEDFNG